MRWRLLDLEAVDGFTMTNLYEAVAKAVSEHKSLNTLILTHPAEPFVNVGFHQIVEKEVDIEFARREEFSIVRRSIGGGTILDGPWEQDYFFIVEKHNSECPAKIQDFYRKFLSIIVQALKRIGVQAEYKPINDIIVKDRKISGNGGITVDEAMVLAGDVLLDLPTDLMTQILKVPDQKFRDKLKKSLSEWMTSLKLELGQVPMREELKKHIVEEFKAQIGVTIEEGELLTRERQYLEELLIERKQKEWIFKKDMSHRRLFQAVKTRRIKVKEGVYICEGFFKAQKLIRITMEVVDDRIGDISISGDFFTEPYMGIIEQLEQSLVGALLDKEVLRQRIQTCLNTFKFKVIGATVDDFADAILVAKEAKAS